MPDQRPGRRRRVALAILSSSTPPSWRPPSPGDKAMVARANGIGPKLAQRIVNELAGKLGPPGWPRPPARPRRPRAPARTPCPRSPTSASSPPRPARRSPPRSKTRPRRHSRRGRPPGLAQGGQALGYMSCRRGSPGAPMAQRPHWACSRPGACRGTPARSRCRCTRPPVGKPSGAPNALSQAPR